MIRKPMFEYMADDIAAAVAKVMNDYRSRIKKRKCAPSLVTHWVLEGARRGLGKR